MTWKNITVQQYQQLCELWSGDVDKEAYDVLSEAVAICYNMTAHQVASLPLSDLNKFSKGLAFMNDLPDWQPVHHITVNGRRYRFTYDVRNIRAARCMEVKQLGKDDLVSNMHKVAASMVVPQRRRWFGWWDAKYDAAKHEQYSADLRQAPLTAIYGSALFFCELFKRSIVATSDYLTSTLPMTERNKARQLLLDSCSYLAGSTPPPVLPSTNAYPSTTPTTSLTSNS